MIGCATGQHFRTAELTARKAGGAQREFFRITLEEVVISSYQTAGSGDGTAPQTDQITLSFERLAMGYKEQKPDGSLGEEVTGKFDFVANRRL
jgi:type VI secretion system secreted protein Hcp